MILVLVEPGSPSEPGLSVLSAEALTFAVQLAAVGGAAPAAVEAVAVGEFPADSVTEIGRYGVSVLHHAQDDRLRSYSAAAWAACVVDAVFATMPSVLLAAASPRGNEILAHVCARLDLRMAANVTDTLSAELGGPDTGDAVLVVHRQVMGGAALEELDLVGSPAILTMAGHAVEPAPVEIPIPVEVREVTPASITDASRRARAAVT
jgi:electron transfer flavoprotein alpha subunit